ncbi:hypothetical protein ZIOFF_054747 [Zingiber officinale]|uniref:Uncharacterized protein n=1 Tax=Zingiber officinale TaxID=94328 RepID=A0A8J5FEV0_ZINOF|nr:hypothetical protein ZIOFF_054747 [Zingiber officinale]
MIINQSSNSNCINALQKSSKCDLSSDEYDRSVKGLQRRFKRRTLLSLDTASSSFSRVLYFSCRRPAAAASSCSEKEKLQRKSKTLDLSTRALFLFFSISPLIEADLSFVFPSSFSILSCERLNADGGYSEAGTDRSWSVEEGNPSRLRLLSSLRPRSPPNSSGDALATSSSGDAPSPARDFFPRRLFCCLRLLIAASRAQRRRFFFLLHLATLPNLFISAGGSSSSDLLVCVMADNASETSGISANPMASSGQVQPFFTMAGIGGPGLQIVSEKLSETNYASWAVAIELYVEGHDKLDILHGSKVKPDMTCGRHWSRCSMSVTNYFATLKGLWDEFDYYRMENWSSTDDHQRYLKLLEKDRIIKFLDGLNAEFENLKGQILGLDPTPSLEQVYYKILSEEGRGDRFCRHCKRTNHDSDFCCEKYPEKKPEKFKHNAKKAPNSGNIAIQKLENEEIIGSSVPSTTGLSSTDIVNLQHLLSRLQAQAHTGIHSLGLSVTGPSFYSPWVIDSGAIDHMTNVANSFISYSLSSGQEKVIIADGTKATVAGKGSIKLTDHFFLSSALHDLETKQTIGTDREVGGLYYYQLETTSALKSAAKYIITYKRRRHKQGPTVDRLVESDAPAPDPVKQLSSSVEPTAPQNMNELNLPIAVRKGVRSCTQHPISNHVSYSRLSPSYHVFVSQLSNHAIPSSYYEAIATAIDTPKFSGMNNEGNQKFMVMRGMTTENFDPVRYSGRWFEVASLKRGFAGQGQEDCHCTQGIYSFDAQTPSIQVDTFCVHGGPDGYITGIRGKVECLSEEDTEKTETNLERREMIKEKCYLRFPTLPFIPKEPYDVITTDYDNFSIVSGAKDKSFVQVCHEN